MLVTGGDVTAATAIAVWFLALASSGCTRAGACYFGASGERDPIARQLAEARCDEIARDERAERAVREAEQARATEAAQAQVAVDAEAAHRVRAMPMVPEFGETPLEAQDTCSAQGGVQGRPGPDGFVLCFIGGVMAFGVRFDASGRVFHRYSRLEGTAATGLRDLVAQTSGPPHREVIEDGRRAWYWTVEARELRVGSYAGGASLSDRRLDVTAQAGN